jgi:hypothetical protein
VKLNLAKEFPNNDADDPLVALYVVLRAQSEYIRALEIALENGARSLAAEGRKARKARAALNTAMQHAMDRMNSGAVVEEGTE